jgi:hypothetical protein
MAGERPAASAARSLTMPSEPLGPLEVALVVARAFVKLGIPYFLGGSLASSVQGEPRATNDIDFVVDLPEHGVPALAAELGPDFDVDSESLTDAVRRRSSWNIFYLPSLLKVDLFLRRNAPFDESEFARRAPVEVLPGENLVLKSPEDTVLRKLLWFRDGGSTSTTQWRDVIEVLRVSGPTLDAAYLDDWASRLELSELLTRAREDSRLERE